MSKIFQLKGGQYEHPNEYKLVGTVRGTTILQPEFGTVIIEGDVIEASTHNTIQKNGVLASKVNVTMESTDTVLVPKDMTIESDLFNELKIILLFETGTTLPSNSFIKLKETNVPIANVNDYIVNANTPLLFLYFDSKFYAYKTGLGTSTGAESLGDLSDVTLTSPTNGQALVYDGSKFVNKSVGGTGGGTTPSPDVLELHSGTFNSLKAQVNYSVTKLGRVCTISIRITAAAGQQNVISGNLLYKIWSSIPSKFAPSTKYPLIANETTFKAFTYANAYVEYASPPLQPMRVWISPDGIEVEAGQWGITLPLSFSFTYFTDGVV